MLQNLKPLIRRVALTDSPTVWLLVMPH